MSEGAAGDRELWRAAQLGDATAFGDLFERHVERVRVFCFRRLASWALAEDAASMVFMEAWRKRDVVEVPSGSLLPWLFATARHVTSNLDRSRRRYAQLLERIPAPAAVPDIAQDVAALVDEERQMRLVLAALRGLSDKDRDVVALCDWEGLSYLEAAAVLRVPVGTVRSRLFRARERLRAVVAAHPSVAGPGVAVEFVEKPDGGEGT